MRRCFENTEQNIARLIHNEEYQDIIFYLQLHQTQGAIYFISGKIKASEALHFEALDG
jgi:hypothetical protein